MLLHFKKGSSVGNKKKRLSLLIFLEVTSGGPLILCLHEETSLLSEEIAGKSA